MISGNDDNLTTYRFDLLTIESVVQERTELLGIAIDGHTNRDDNNET
jgi:hypothetical protein